MKLKRMPVSLSDKEFELLKNESERTGLSRSEVLRQLFNESVLKPGLRYNPGIRKITKSEWSEAVKARDNYKCNYCGKQGTKGTTEAHHKIPKKFGGKNEIVNGVTYCRSCHRIVHVLIDKIFS